MQELLCPFRPAHLPVPFTCQYSILLSHHIGKQKRHCLFELFNFERWVSSWAFGNVMRVCSVLVSASVHLLVGLPASARNNNRRRLLSLLGIAPYPETLILKV